MTLLFSIGLFVCNKGFKWYFPWCQLGWILWVVRKRVKKCTISLAISLLFEKKEKTSQQEKKEKKTKIKKKKKKVEKSAQFLVELW